jgi:hypothetical protein
LQPAQQPQPQAQPQSQPARQASLHSQAKGVGRWFMASLLSGFGGGGPGGSVG